LQSTIPASLAYVWMDGTLRVVPIWFHWNEREFVLGTSPKAPKLTALAKNPKVALTIDDNTFPHKVAAGARVLPGCNP
jgi:nitroimidazol reductase NimA-like FMN-containing flavoprotein (pyridoxamine 5'-phosphate oxidase superfamily)